jgi:hypothetical protein
MFDRCVRHQQAHLEVGRRYLQAFGLVGGITALLSDMSEGRLPWDKAQQVLSHMHYLFIEHLARRVGFTRFGAVLADAEHAALQEESALRGQRSQEGASQKRQARAREMFAWNSLRHWHLVAHDQGGRNMYEVHSALASRLLRPRLLEQSWRAPRLPVSSLVVLVPAEAGLELTLKGFAPRPVTEIYVVESAHPQHQWAVWLHAPIDENVSESVYLEMTFSPGGSFEEGLASAHELFQGESPLMEGWRECVRWLGAVMHYLAKGGAQQTLQPREPALGRCVRLGMPEILQ